MAMATGFSLAELITHTANELRKAAAERGSRKPVMQLAQCEIELAVTVRTDVEGGFKFFVIDFTTAATYQTASTIRLSFAPPDGSGAVTFAVEPG